MHKRITATRGGFTLLEVVVALILIGLLVGAVVPTVVNQLGRGDINRAVEDLNTVSTGAKSFRVDVNRYPGDLEDLVASLSTSGPSADVDLNGSAYPTGLAAKWAGPYLERGGLRADNTIATAYSGSILNAFSKTSWGGRDFLTVRITGIAQADANNISTTVDGDTAVFATAETSGRVRWKAGSPDTLIFLATPVQ